METEFWTEKDTDIFLKEREVLDKLNTLTWNSVLEGEVIEKLRKVLRKVCAVHPELKTVEDAARYIRQHTAGPIYDLVSKIIEIPDAPAKETSEYADSMLEELLHGDHADKTYDCQHLLTTYMKLHPKVETADEAAKLILDSLSGYDRYSFGKIYAEYRHSIGVGGYDILKKEEDLAQQVIDMFPPSLAKEYQDNNKIVWALRLASRGK